MAVVLEPRVDLSSAEDSCFPSLSKYTETAAFAARAGLSLEQGRSEQPRVEANLGSVCLGCWGAGEGGTHRRAGLGLWLLPRSPVGSRVPPSAASGTWHHLLPHVVLGLQGWCPLPVVFPIPGVAVLSFKTPRMFLWAVRLGLSVIPGAALLFLGRDVGCCFPSESPCGCRGAPSQRRLRDLPGLSPQTGVARRHGSWLSVYKQLHVGWKPPGKLRPAMREVRAS